MVTYVYKKSDPFNKENYRPLNVLTSLSKVVEKAIEYQLSSFLESHFSEFLCADHKRFSSQHALIRQMEDWRTDLEPD